MRMPKIRSLVLVGLSITAMTALATTVFATPTHGTPSMHGDTAEALQAGRQLPSRRDAGLPPPSGPRFTGPVQWRGASGHTSNHVTVLGKESDTYALGGIRWWEKADRPCKFSALQQSSMFGLEPPADLNALPGTQYMSHCDIANMNSEKYVGVPSLNAGISAIAVCVNDKKSSSNERLKGIRLWSRAISPGATQLGPESGPAETRRTNCDEWMSKASCASDELAAIIRLYSSSNGTNGFVRGIELGCRKIVF